MNRKIEICLNSDEAEWIITTNQYEDCLLLMTSKEFQKLLKHIKKNHKICDQGDYSLSENSQEMKLKGSYIPSKKVQEKFGFDKERIIIFTEKDSDRFEIWTHSSFIRKNPYSNTENWHDQTVLVDNLDHVEVGFN